MCFSLFSFLSLYGFACCFFYSIYTLVLCQFLSNYQLSSMHQILLWGGVVAVNLQIILVGSNPSHIICISLPWGTSLPYPQIPTPTTTTKFLMFSGSENPWPSPKISKYSLSDMWNPFFIVPHLWNVVSSGLSFGFIISMFLWISVVLLQPGGSHFSVWSEQIHKTLWFVCWLWL